MIIVISEAGSIKIPSKEWPAYLEKLSGFNGFDDLSLIITKNRQSLSFSVTVLKTIASGCLNNRLIALPGGLKSFLLKDIVFEPLALGIREHINFQPEPNELTLLIYFYLNPVPSSVSLITRWFIDSGTNPEKASELAEIVYMARTEKIDQDPAFLSDFEKTITPEIEIPNGFSFWFKPETLTETFNILSETDEVFLSYDCLDHDNIHTGKFSNVLELSNLDETGFIVEDHAILIAGLSVNVSEFARLTENKWPHFTDALLTEIPIYLRDHYSLGRLVLNNPEFLLRLNTVDNLNMDIISFLPDGNKVSTFLKSFKLYMQTEKRHQIPLFLRIIK